MMTVVVELWEEDVSTGLFNLGNNINILRFHEMGCLLFVYGVVKSVVKRYTKLNLSSQNLIFSLLFSHLFSRSTFPKAKKG